jgi:bis(5'-nucleosyl)-tetraphosphatase (symmetrical)
MARYAIGDVQGCLSELETLLEQCRFNADRDQVWLVGDLVNRGPDSLGVLRLVRALDANAKVVLGNHDLHLIALAFGDGSRKARQDDTLADILAAPDRDALLEWLCMRSLAVSEGRDLLVHAGVIPQWSVDDVLELAREVEQVLRRDPRSLSAQMYGNLPDRWSASLSGAARWRFVINTLTRMRYASADGQLDLKRKSAPKESPDPSPFQPWFDLPQRQTHEARLITGHWSTLGIVRRDNLLCLDSGCVWGGALSVVNLDEIDEEGLAPLRQLPCAGYQQPG